MPKKAPIKKEPKVSVLIPMYNAEGYVCTSIEMALNQTMKPFEVVVYDDGSTDSSIETVNSKYGKRVRLIRGEKNMGIGFARKRLVEEAKGDYMCFISADDMMQPNYIEEMLKASKEHPNRIIYSNYNVVDANGVFMFAREAEKYDTDEDWVMGNILRARANTMSVCYNIFSPSKILKENNFDETLEYGEDLEHLMRCTIIKKIGYFHVDKSLFNYRTHPGAVTSKESKNIPENNRKIFRMINKLAGERIL